MRKIKWLALALACVMCVCMLAGCKEEVADPTTTAPATEPITEPTQPSVDADALLEKYTGKDAPVLTGLEFLAELDIADGMAMEISGSVRLSSEPAKLYMLMRTKVTALDLADSSQMEIYGFEEDGQFLTYVHDMSWDMWNSSAEPMQEWTSVKLPAPENAEVEPHTQLRDGVECYVLTARLSDQQLQQLLGENTLSEMGAGAGITDLDNSGISADCTVYVEKETLLIREMHLELKGLEEMLGSVSAQISGITYEPVEVPEISDMDRLIADAQNHVEEPDPTEPIVPQPTDPTVPDPTEPVPSDPTEPVTPDPTEPTEQDPPQETGYLIQEGGVAFRVTVPEGWTLDYAEGSMFSMTGSAASAMASGTVYLDDGATLEDSLQTYVQLLELFLGTEVASGAGESIDGNPVVWYSYDGCCAYMMRIPNGSGYLLLEVQDAQSATAYANLQQIAACVKGQ